MSTSHPTLSPSAAVPPEDSRSLRRLNVAIGVFHLLQAGLMIALSNELALPVTASFLTGDPVSGRELRPEVLFELPVGPAVAAFLLLAAIDHLAVALPGLRTWYERHLARGASYARWVEYSVSASLMIALIAMLTGIWDIAALIGLVGVNSAMIWFGLLMERDQTPGRPDWTAFALGTVAGLIPWIAIGVYLAGAATPPTFVYAIYAVQLTFFTAFGVNQLLQYRMTGRWRDYLFGERVYIWLSLGAKSALAWLIFANVLRA